MPCSVRTLERSVVLVLRRSKVKHRLAGLPLTTREAWSEEERRTRAAHEEATSLWLARKLRQLSLFGCFSPPVLRALERASSYCLVPAHTPLPRGPHTIILLAGEIVLSEGPSPRRVSAHSDVPMVGVEALLQRPSPTYKMSSRTDCQMLRLNPGDLSEEVLAELCARLTQVVDQPLGLKARLVEQPTLHPDCASSRSSRPSCLSQRGGGSEKQKARASKLVPLASARRNSPERSSPSSSLAASPRLPDIKQPSPRRAK